MQLGKDETRDLAALKALVARLRAPDGCPWDREQAIPDLRAYLLEEAHEVAAAIDSGDFGELEGELGDLLFQVVFVTALAEEAGAFDLDKVWRAFTPRWLRAIRTSSAARSSPTPKPCAKPGSAASCARRSARDRSSTASPPPCRASLPPTG